MGKELLRDIPSVHELLEHDEIKLQMDGYGRELVLSEINLQQEILRSKLLSGEFIFPGEFYEYRREHSQDVEVNYRKILKEVLVDWVKKGLKHKTSPRIKRVINATGTVIHTNLGRAPLPKEVCEELYFSASTYNNLELDLNTGERGSRYEHVEDLICTLTGAEGALVVNNNAAAVMLVLSNLAKGKEVVISRGELVEIGGSFRVPEVMKQSGAILKEVGTTNRTNLEDYREAIGEETAMLLSVHTSNYKIIGFTQNPSLEDMAELACEYKIPLVKDLGSGLLNRLEGYDEPPVTEAISKGADLVTFSGDKLLGGPQSGIIIGKEKYIKNLKKDQLTRALRIDKLTLKAFESILRLYLDPEKASQKIPVLLALILTEKELKDKACKLASALDKSMSEKFKIEINRDTSRVGGGAMPEVELPTWVLTIKGSSKELEELNYRLRVNEPPVLLRFKSENLLIDPRTLFDMDMKELPEIIGEVSKNITV